MDTMNKRIIINNIVHTYTLKPSEESKKLQESSCLHEIHPN
jgi:hypothetical protein